MAMLLGSSPAASDLLGTAGTLIDQVTGETEEERKKRLQQAAQQKLVGMTPGVSALGMGLGGREGASY